MIRRSPAELYIKYLIIHPRGYRNDEIKDVLTFAQLDFIGDWYVDRLRLELQVPTPFYPRITTHVRSQEFLLQNGLRRFFQPDEAVRQAFDVLQKPRVKEYVETLLISNAPPSSLSHYLKSYMHFTIGFDGIMFFKNAFWNVDLIDSVELRALLQRRGEALEGHTDPQVMAQHRAFKKASYNDPRRAAAEMPFSPVSTMISMMKMGFFPGKFELAKLAEGTRIGALARSYEATFRDGPEDHVKARDYANTAKMITEILENIVRPDEQLREQLSAIALKTDDVRVPVIHELSGGAHTVDIAPLEKKHDR